MQSADERAWIIANLNPQLRAEYIKAYLEASVASSNLDKAVKGAELGNHPFNIGHRNAAIADDLNAFPGPQAFAN